VRLQAVCVPNLSWLLQNAFFFVARPSAKNTSDDELTAWSPPGITELREGPLADFMEGCFESTLATSWLVLRASKFRLQAANRACLAGSKLHTRTCNRVKRDR